MKLSTTLMALAAALSVSTAAQAGVVYQETFDGYGAIAAGANGATSSTGNSFTTDYAYRPPGYNSMWAEGSWTIGTNPIDTHQYWVDAPSDNNMLILNGVEGASLEHPALAWLSKGFAVDAGSYTFSFDLMNVCCNTFHPSVEPSKLWFYFTDNAGQTFELASGGMNAPTLPGQFFSQTGGFTLANAGTIHVALRDTNGAHSGNDFAIDNIVVSSVAAVPEPATWALMIGGFGLAGATLRRRRALGVAA